jgi:glycosyltransferase involved in cell wall biosynthesis
MSPANYGPLFAPSTIIMLRNSLAVVGREKRPVKRLYWGGLTLMTALSLLTCRRAVAVSDYARKTLTFGLGERFQKKVVVIHHGVSANFKADRTVIRENYLLAVSDIYVQKNLHTMALALVSIKIFFPDITLKIAGKPLDKGYLEELNSVLIQNNLTNSVEFLGEQTDKELVRLYQCCKLFIFPSTVETFGNPLVEAMACGAPIVCSNTAVMPEIIGNSGSYFDPLNVNQMSEKIIEALKDDKARMVLSKKALKRSRRFSWTKTAVATANVIKGVVPDRYAEVLANKMQKTS